MQHADGRLIEHLHLDYNEMKNKRGLWNQQFQDIVRFCRPGTTDFLRELTDGRERHYEIYNDIAVLSLDQFASGLHSYNTSPSDRWFDLTFPDEDLMQEAEVRAWLDKVSDIVFREIGRPDVGFNQSMHETYLDLGSLGTSIVYLEYDKNRKHLVFRTMPLSNCYIRENHLGLVDTVFRKMQLTSRQICQRFPDCKNLEAIKMSKPHKEWNIIHAVFPSTDEYGIKHHTTKPFVSYWFCKEMDDGHSPLGGILYKGGFDEFPYLVPRWTKIAGETYGRSPGMAALNSIRTANEADMTIMKKADQVTNPSLEVDDDSVIGDIEMGSGSIIWKEPGSEPIRPVNVGARLDLGYEFLDRKEQTIAKHFFLDRMLRARKNERQTAYEIADERDQMLMSMSPMLGRLQVELYGPLIRRVYNLLATEGKIPEMEFDIDAEMQIEYTNPASKAQYAVKGQNARRFVEQVGLIMQWKPEVADKINTDELMELWATTGDVPQNVLHTNTDTNDNRQARANIEAQQMQTQNAPLEARAVKDLAQADKIRSEIPI